MAQVDFENVLKDAIGLDIASIGSSSIERAVRLRMASLGLNQADDYRQHLFNSTGELQELIEMVVVPETWFFRDQEAFATLVRLVTEEWRSAHSAGLLRLLSVPCSTGEEPYSMVMSLLDGGFSPQQLQVHAMDISVRSLAGAARGVYGLNSFRGENLSFRERYFQKTAKGYALAEWLRGMVTFRQGNLLSPDFRLCQERYDVIFCRNLLIYFDRSAQKQAIEMLARLLKPGGLLFVGPAETFLASSSGFASVNQAMSFAFRSIGETPSSARSAHGRRKPLKKLTTPGCPQVTAASKLSAPTLVPPGPTQADLETAQRLADAGRLKEAASWCETILIEQGPSSETFYLLGLVHDAMGDPQSAAAFYRKVIYLEPEHVEALMHLALITETHGDKVAAERLRERARRVAGRTQEVAS